MIHINAILKRSCFNVSRECKMTNIKKTQNITSFDILFVNQAKAQQIGIYNQNSPIEFNLLKTYNK